MEPRAKGTDFEEILNRSTIPGKITMNFLEGTHPENLPVLITDFVLDKTAKASPIETINILKSLPLGLRTIYILVRFEDSVNQKGFYNTFKKGFSCFVRAQGVVFFIKRKKTAGLRILYGKKKKQVKGA